MLRTRRLAGVGALAVATAAIVASPASAANGPTFRDCSLLAPGFDPDFVELFGVRVDPQGNLTVPPSQHLVSIEALESSDPGDSNGGVTLDATVTPPHGPARTVTGAGIGKVLLSLPLHGAGVGGSYTISWSATFDNGNHPCPGPLTPENPAPNPFVVAVSRR
jgi:hypothetical protein